MDQRQMDRVLKDKSKTILADFFDVTPDVFADIRIVELNLSVRSFNRLKEARIKTLAGVLSKSMNELREVRCLGEKGVEEIVQKINDYLVNPTIIDAYVRHITPIKEHQKVRGDSYFFSTIEDYLLGEECTLDNLNAKQLECFGEVQEAVDMIGEELCLEAYLSPDYSTALCNMLCEFSTPNVQYQNLVKGLKMKIEQLTDFMKMRKVIPFIRAYAVKKGTKLQWLLSECTDDTRILDIPSFYEKMQHEENMIQLIIAAINFLDWLNFDIEELIASTFRDAYSNLESGTNRCLEVFSQKIKGETYEPFKVQDDLTKEYIRQLEKKAFHTFWKVYKKQKYDLIMMVYALRNGATVIDFDEFQETVGDHYASMMWICIEYLQKNELYFYSKKLNAIIVKSNDETMMNEITILSAMNKFLGSLPSTMEFSEKEKKLADIAKRSNFSVKMLNKGLSSIYQEANGFFFKERLNDKYMFEYVLKHRFMTGFKIADDFEADRFRKYMHESFGDQAKSMKNKTLDARIGKIGVLCGRGKYIHPDLLQVDQKVMDAINDFLEKSPRSLLTYGEIFSAMEDTLKGTQITNKYLLQGALKKYGCRFITRKDYVSKLQSTRFVDELEAFMAKHGIVHKSEILAEFSSLDERVLYQIVSRSTNLVYFAKGYFIHASVFNILPEDYEQLRSHLKEACKDSSVNIRSVYAAVAARFPEFMCRNNLSDKNELFSALNYMFKDEFVFSRPYIAKLGMEDITNRSVVLQHIKDYNIIEIKKLVDICDENGIRHSTPAKLCQSLAPEYVRINRTTVMRRELAGITQEVIDSAVNIVIDMLKVNKYIVGSKVHDFARFPHIDVDWNEFLLESLIVQSGKINIVNLTGASLKHSNAVYVSDEYKNDKHASFLVKIVSDEVDKGTFTSKTEMRAWLKEKGLIGGKLPICIKRGKFFYV